MAKTKTPDHVRKGALLLLAFSSLFAVVLLFLFSVLDLSQICEFSDAAKIGAFMITGALSFSVLSMVIYDVPSKLRRYFFGTEIALLICIVLNFAVIYSNNGVNSPGDMQDIVDYVYFSVVTVTTLGYGELHPTRDFRPYAAWQAAFGFIYVPIVLAELMKRMNR